MDESWQLEGLWSHVYVSTCVHTCMRAYTHTQAQPIELVPGNLMKLASWELLSSLTQQEECRLRTDVLRGTHQALS